MAEAATGEAEAGIPPKTAGAPKLGGAPKPPGVAEAAAEPKRPPVVEEEVEKSPPKVLVPKAGPPKSGWVAGGDNDAAAAGAGEAKSPVKRPLPLEVAG